MARFNAIRLVVNNDKPVKMKPKRRGYETGYAVGVLDKCNGREARNFVDIPLTKYNRGYMNGYLDGYCSNEVRNA